MEITPDSIKKLLYSADFGERIRGINGLRQIEAEKAFEMIKPLITDKNVRVRYAAVSQLDTLGHIDREKSLELLRDRLFNDPEADVKAAAADAIGGLKLTEAFPDLAQVYQESSDWLIQFSIIATLGEFGDPRGLDLLKDALNSDNNLLQTAAISALGELGNVDAIPLLLEFVDNPDWQIRHRLAQALGRLGGSQVNETLKKLAQDEFDPVAQEAKNYLPT